MGKATFKGVITDDIISGILVHVPELVGGGIVGGQGVGKFHRTAPRCVAVIGEVIFPCEADHLGLPAQILEILVTHAEGSTDIDLGIMHPVGQVIQGNGVVVDLGVAGNTAAEEVVGQVDVVVVDALELTVLHAEVAVHRVDLHTAVGREALLGIGRGLDGGVDDLEIFRIVTENGLIGNGVHVQVIKGNMGVGLHAEAVDQLLGTEPELAVLTHHGRGDVVGILIGQTYLVGG